jgi:hypothetical protein
MEEESYFIGYFRYNQGFGENFLWAGWGRAQRFAKKTAANHNHMGRDGRGLRIL